MNIIRFYSMLVLLCLFSAIQQSDAQCNIALGAAQTNINCFGETGSIDLTVTNAALPASYTWSNGATDEDIDGLLPGQYIVTVMDALGCVANLARNIVGPSEGLVLSLSNNGPITCQNFGSDISSVYSGGTPPYQFKWSDGSTESYLYYMYIAGVYTLTLTDANGCTTSAQNTVLYDSTFPVADAGISRDITCADNTLGGSGTSTGPGFTYLWTSFFGIEPGIDVTQASIAVTQSGIYELTVTSLLGGCSSYDDVWIDIGGPFPQISVQTPQKLSCLVSEVTLNASGSSTGPQYSYQWTTNNGNIVFGETTLTPIVDEAGDYLLSLTHNVDGCTVRRYVSVIGDHIANAGPDTGIPCGDTQVTLDGNGSSNGIQYSYLWTTADGSILSGANTQNPIVNLPGTYTLLVVDTQTGCTKTDDVRVFPGPVIPQGDFSNLDVSCTGQLGIAAVIMTQGTGPYTYLWSNGSVQPSIINIAQGTYSVTVTDATGCDYYGVTEIKDTSTLTLSAQITAPNCIPGNDGAIDLTATGVFGPFEYAWSTGETTQDLNNLTAGTYTVTVTYAVGTCSQTLSVALTNSSGIALSTVVTDANSCLGANGLIDLTVTGGTGPYVYTWSDGENTQDASPLVIGTFTVTVTDASSCTQTTSATVNDGFNLSLNLVKTDASCSGACNGSLNLTVTGGIIPYQYFWSPGNTTQDISGLCQGTYTVTVSDVNGCTKTTSATVGQPPGLTLSAVVTASTACAFTNGAIDLTVAPPGSYTYAWSVGQTTEDLSNIPAGTYTVTVSDGVSCTAVDSYIVQDDPNSPNPSAIATPSTCDLNNGSIDASITGGILPYTFLWWTGATTEDLSNIPSGNYWLTVTGANGCTNTVSVDVTNNNQTITLNATVAPNTVCVGNPNGSIDLTAGPLTTYTYTWSNGATTQDPSNLPPGDYTVTVSAGGTCIEFAIYNVPDNSNAPTIIPIVTDASCNGNDGAIDLTITNGVSPYTVDWFNIPGANNPQDISNLSAGTYTCTVTDAIGCNQVVSVTVGQLSDLSVSFVKNDVACFGGNNGSINLTATGTATPFTYLWSNGSTMEDLGAFLIAGTYTVTVTDANLCSKTVSATITQPADIVLSTVTNPVLCFGGSNGSIDLSVSGGSPGYTYLWNNGSTAQDLNNMPVGIYTVTVTDSHGCIKITNAVVNGSAPLTFTIVSLSNDCSTEVITGPNLPNLTYQWTGPNGFTSTTTAITANFSGLYSLTITNANGCTATNDYTVNLSGGGACGAIIGRVFHDENESCTLNAGEPGLAGWIVRAEGLSDTLYGVTDVLGRYVVGVPVGTYAMKVFVPNGLWTICPGGAMVTVGIAGDTIAGGDFPVQSIFICPALTVSIGTNQLRRCFPNNFYQVEYCNQGTQKAEDAFVTVVLDQYLTVLSVSAPYTDLGANAIQVEVGDLEIGECGMFKIQVFVGCNAQLGQTHCTQAAIYPDTLCVPTNSSWSGASLNISSICDSDSLRFRIQNTGAGGMNGSSGYIVVEDGIMFRSGTLDPLASGASMIIAVPSNGSTWRVEVGQELFHPYAAPVGLSVEGCVTSSSFSTGFVNQFPYNDEPPTLDIDCTTNIGSFDPNDKHGYPVGYGADHYIRPGTDIEYLVRFQNTGTDTAFTVQIVDTLSSWLDPATIRFGASSHPYRYDLNGEGVVHFIFENILLPDSNTNEVASHGFAKFNIKPRSDTPLETLIENTAAIYFDFNDPVFTNTTFHRLGDNFITVGLWQPEMPKAQVIAVPNPFYEQTLLEVKGLVRSTGLRLQVFDLLGNVIREMESENTFFQLKKGDWPSGIYLFKITQNGRLVGSGKLMAE
ncbi:MAG: T9SS type A sorting domain-containing protein [Saprospiraceae bacterium]